MKEKEKKRVGEREELHSMYRQDIAIAIARHQTPETRQTNRKLCAPFLIRRAFHHTAEELS
ncbi:hypothetical protein P167DRAFT_531275 [Morchella conica CCBAS932]|uniref:Uncharacterized protein n=1 Tax=Morchella conica CCBAS932 TaxID=1392247 RepID=A0A3N4L4B0_9PEZI|nr:hypothetical protein P167DRAFT_531275 [Morchella conica CCBAS932]